MSDIQTAEEFGAGLACDAWDALRKDVKPIEVYEAFEALISARDAVVAREAKLALLTELDHAYSGMNNRAWPGFPKLIAQMQAKYAPKEPDDEAL